MVWQRAGTVSVQNGCTTVTGVNVDFAATSRVGDSFIGPDGWNYEVSNVASATVISILPAYKGATVSGAAYAIMPVQGYLKDSADQLRAATKALGDMPVSKQDKSENLTAFSGLAGAADRLPYFTGEGALSVAVISAKSRALLGRTDTAGMQAELALVPVSSSTDVTSGRLVTVGWLGFGASLSPALPGSNANVAIPSGPVYATPATWTGSPYAGTDGRNQGYLSAIVWSVGNYMIQRWVGLDPSWGSYERHYVNGVWRTWTPVYNANNSNLDPTSSTPGLMSSALVGGYLVNRYLNGEVEIRGVAPLTPQVTAGEIRVLTIALPITLVNGSLGFCFSSLTRVQPQQTYDSYGVIAEYMSDPSNIGIVIRNGSTPQTFQPTINVKGRWK